MVGIAAVDTDTGLTPSLARALIRGLVRGTAISSGVRYIHVGHTNWLAAQRELLDEIAADGHADTKFVRGTYGAGKSHFLSMVQDLAGVRNWATSHIECKVDGVQIDRFETLYPQIVGKLRLADMPSGEPDAPNDPIRWMLEKWAREELRRAGVREDALTRPFDAELRLYGQLEKRLLRSSLPQDFIRAAAGFARASLARDAETMAAVCGWISGTKEWISIPGRYLRQPSAIEPAGKPINLRPIGKGSARDAMRGVLWLVRSAGYAGLVLCIDEIEELAKLGSKKRQDQALQTLREYVDHAGGEGGFRNLCMYLAATPEMFESEEYFPRYDALATRIQAVSTEVNWRGPVIDLDRTPLDGSLMREMAARICKVYAVAYGAQIAQQALSKETISQLVDRVNEARFRIAKPRLLARVVVDSLERIRQGKSAKQTPDARELVTAAASIIAKELGA
ncbi:BREX system ATP-binding domain-containing protein [Bradyrhizobium sp. 33ap4]|uniref:BREX system ATP-binding domain-containing protein n=1 Tax=Bradyrhizobium sp. 33ap4 TaxID=3061630 RepID=UPI0029318AE7|nr:BREX system ATP-binding domain-containing protein [Bradyrhizobium sp. 33ap4]